MENAHEVPGSATQSTMHASMQTYTYTNFYGLLKTPFSLKLRLSRRINYENSLQSICILVLLLSALHRTTKKLSFQLLSLQCNQIEVSHFNYCQ